MCSCSSDTGVCREECIISVGDSMYVTRCVLAVVTQVCTERSVSLVSVTQCMCSSDTGVCSC